MTERKIGRIVSWRNLSSNLAIFRMVPDNGCRFPEYRSGQYIALGREDCRLTRKIVVDGKLHTIPDLDECGKQKIGPVTHSYSIASAPFETQNESYLEFYLVLEKDGDGNPGRLTESLFRLNLDINSKLHYLDRVQGDFTLERRVNGASHVLLIGTGTGTAPFVSMIKQKNFEASGAKDQTSYTLIHVSRTFEELGYYDEFREIERQANIDFLYLPAVSRPDSGTRNNDWLGIGRANNILRMILDLPLKEEEDLRQAMSEGQDESVAAAAVEKTIRPELPRRIELGALRRRLNPEALVLLSCGNPNSLADIEHVAKVKNIRFEREEW